jgi:hypothetical protein
MIVKNIIEETFVRTITGTGVVLKPLGFSRHGKLFRLIEQDNCGIIEFQRSGKNSRDGLLFTVNLGVVCGELLDSVGELRKARVVDAHVRERIGMLLPGRPDKWWEISRATEACVLEREISDLILRKAVPYIQSYLGTDRIISLWESGRSPGLTDGQRVQFLTRLKARRTKESV